MIVHSGRVVLPEGMQPATLHVREGRIERIDRDVQSAPPDVDIDASDLVILPGLVDTHVHINEPGRTDWEGFAAATRAAAAGGVTTLVDMPLNSIPATTTVQALDEKRAAAQGQLHVDVAFWGGVVPGNSEDLEPLILAGVRGFKCFLSPSGVDEFPNVTEADLQKALPVIRNWHVPLLAHAEWPAELREPLGERRRYSTWLDSRPPEAERRAIRLLANLSFDCARSRAVCRVHIVHLATSAALPVIREARARGVPVTVETCPHYLTFAAEDIPDGDTRFKCAPPIRSSAEREQLWNALIAGEIDLIATDHSPAPPAMKRLADGDFVAAWGGIASLQVGLAAVWTEARERGVSPEKIARWMSEAPAHLARLSPHKGNLTVGADADFVIWDPDGETLVDQTALYHRHPLTPYHGRRLAGEVKTTVLGGEVIYDDDVCAGVPKGRLR
jgi:allantoinase